MTVHKLPTSNVDPICDKEEDTYISVPSDKYAYCYDVMVDHLQDAHDQDIDFLQMDSGKSYLSTPYVHYLGHHDGEVG